MFCRHRMWHCCVHIGSITVFCCVVLTLQSVVDTIVSMHVPEEVDEEVQFASLQLLQTAIELMCKQIHDETESLLTNSASDESLVLKGTVHACATLCLFLC